MTSSDRTPDASADARDRAAATEGYGGVPISEEELAQVWTTSDGDEAGSSAQTVESADPAEDGDTKPEVPEDDPAPTEPS